MKTKIILAIVLIGLPLVAYNLYIKRLYADLTQTLYVKFNPTESIKTFKRLSQIQNPSSDIKKSIADCYYALAKTSSDSIYAIMKNRYYSIPKDIENLAISNFDEAIKLDSSNNEIFYDFARFCDKTNKNSKAVALYSKLIALNPGRENNKEYFLALIDALVGNGNFEQAIDSCSKELTIAPIESEQIKGDGYGKNIRSQLLIRLARVYRKQKYQELALNKYFEAIQSEHLWGDYHQTYSNQWLIVDALEEIGTLYNDIGDIPNSLRYLERSVGIVNGRVVPWSLGTFSSNVVRRNWILGSIYLKVGRKQDAIGAFERAVERWEHSGQSEIEGEWAKSSLNNLRYFRNE
ncbi:MAG: tetratricopeptide repeat protein [Candidatus Kapabacteria bacterium]|nr:tetratricopeptide repeat protein [Candidatus Kapabacteria bacterium]